MRAELLAYAEIVAPTARARVRRADRRAGGRRRRSPPTCPRSRRAPPRCPAEIRAALGVDAALAGRLDALPPLPAPGEPVLGAPLAPVEDIDALADLLGRAVEFGAPHEDIERALDGISRFCHSRAPFERELKPLVARLGDLRWPDPGRAGVRRLGDRARSARLAACGRRRHLGVAVPGGAGRPRSPSAPRGCSPAPLLAAPTHAGVPDRAQPRSSTAPPR